MTNHRPLYLYIFIKLFCKLILPKYLSLLSNALNVVCYTKTFVLFQQKHRHQVQILSLFTCSFFVFFLVGFFWGLKLLSVMLTEMYFRLSIFWYPRQIFQIFRCVDLVHVLQLIIRVKKVEMSKYQMPRRSSIKIQH